MTPSPVQPLSGQPGHSRGRATEPFLVPWRAERLFYQPGRTRVRERAGIGAAPAAQPEAVCQVLPASGHLPCGWPAVLRAVPENAWALGLVASGDRVVCPMNRTPLGEAGALAATPGRRWAVELLCAQQDAGSRRGHDVHPQPARTGRERLLRAHRRAVAASASGSRGSREQRPATEMAVAMGRPSFPSLGCLAAHFPELMRKRPRRRRVFR